MKNRKYPLRRFPAILLVAMQTYHYAESESPPDWRPVKVFDNRYENRTVWPFEVDGEKKYIIMHEEDKFGRGPHLHTADALHGDPLEPRMRYN